MRILLAIDFDIEARLLEGILVSGHDVVDRVAGADALIESVSRNRPDVVIAQGGPETLTPRSLAACDAAGSRIVVLMADEIERRNTLALGIVDRLDAQVEWPELERLIRSERRDEDVAGLDQVASGTPGGPPGGLSNGSNRANGSTGRVTQGRDGTASEVPPISRRERKSLERDLAKRQHDRDGGAKRDAKTRDRKLRRVGKSADPQAELVGAGQPSVAVSGVSDSRPGQVVAVWGPHGAPGRTTLAISLAASFANRGKRAVLIDADTYGGAIAQLLGITDEAPGLAAACRLAGANALNSLEFERVSSIVKTLSSSMRVLSGIVNPERWPELSRGRMRGVIERAKLEADVVIVDVGFNLERDEELVSDVSAPRRNAATHTALELSDTVLALAEATPLGMQRYLRARLHLLESVAASCHVEAVANRVRGSVNGVDAGSQVREVLRRFGGIERVALLPNDPKACDRAIANAMSVVDASPRSALSRQIGALADRVLAGQRQSASESLVGLSRVEHHQPHSAL